MLRTQRLQPAALAIQPPAARKAARSAARPAQTAPHWTDYERLEARLREDQVEQLDVLTRRLNKRRDEAGERITKNTLLRAALDLLLERQGDIRVQRKPRSSHPSTDSQTLAPEPAVPLETVGPPRQMTTPAPSGGGLVVSQAS